MQVNCKSRELLVAVSYTFFFDFAFMNSNNHSGLAWTQLPVHLDNMISYSEYLAEFSNSLNSDF